MAKKAADRGKEIVLELVGQAKTPELKAALAQLGADPELLTMLGDKTLKQDEFSRLANELKAKETQFNDDYARVQQHENEVTEHYRKNYKHVLIGQEVEKAGGLEKLLGEGRVRGAGDTGEDEDEELTPARRAAPAVKIDTSKFLTAEQLENRIRQERGQMIGSMRELNALTSKLAVEYFTEFGGKVLDVQALYEFCDKHQLPMNKGGYEAYVKDLRSENNQKDFDKKIAEAKKEGAREALESVQRGDGAPYLVGNGGDGTPVMTREPSVLDILKARKAGKDASAAVAGDATSDVMAAVAEYTAGVGRASLGIGRA